MTFIPDNNKGRLFDNRIDRTSPKQPDWTGTATVEGTMVKVSGWFNPPDERSKVATIGLQFENYADYRARIDAKKAAAGEVDPRNHAPAIPPEERSNFPDEPAPPYDDDIPF
jgi:hypothetical protein